jgi:hypothetical protein
MRRAPARIGVRPVGEFAAELSSPRGLGKNGFDFRLIVFRKQGDLFVIDRAFHVRAQGEAAALVLLPRLGDQPEQNPPDPANSAVLVSPARSKAVRNAYEPYMTSFP